MTNICGIYKITSPSGKVYIGQSNNILDRCNRYRGLRCKGQKHLYNSLVKYGWNNHKFEVIHKCDSYDLNEIEIKYIAYYDSTNREIGLNLSHGGKNSKHSEESKDKIRRNHPRCKKVYTKKDGIRLEFFSIGDASRKLKMSRKTIKQCLKGNQIGKLIWYKV